VAGILAIVDGVAIRPGVSLNRRLYTPEVLAAAVARAQKRIEAGESLDLVDRTDKDDAAEPLSQLTHHGAEDDSTRVVGRITSLSLGEAGEVKFKAAIAPTEHGRTIATLLDTSDGKPAYLKGVSIRGAWLGTPRTVTAPDGKAATAGAALELDGLDYTRRPGVTGAQVTGFQWADGRPPDETAEAGTDGRVLITESVQEAAVTFTEEAGDGTQSAPGPPEGVREAVRAVFAPAEAHELDDGFCVTCVAEKKGGKTPYGDVTYADPGYQKDKVKRYPLDSQAHVRAAWSYVNMPKNAAKYTSDQLKRIKGRIKAAMGRIGAKVAPESEVVGGFVIGEAVEASPEVLEWLGEDPKRSGSWSIGASNGPVNLSLSSYCMDPAELNVILRAAADAACLALKRLDPDMGGDIDVPGAPNADTDGDLGKSKGKRGETASEDDEPLTETDPAGAGDETPAEAGTETGSEDPAMAEDTTTGTGGAAPTLAQVTEAAAAAAAAAVTAAFEARDAAKAQAKQEAREAEEREAREAAARKTALTEALAELGIKIPAPATEGTVGGGGGGETAPESTALTEADVEKRIGTAVTEALTEFKQALMTSGAILPARAGLVVREHAIPDADNAPDTEALQKMSDDDLMSYMGGAMAQQADLIRPVGAQA
jgi:hypothetical protein